MGWIVLSVKNTVVKVSRKKYIIIYDNIYASIKEIKMHLETHVVTTNYVP